jgi:hypothetical protein
MSLPIDILMQGLASARPAASAANAGKYYFETDTDGGTLFQSTGSAWVQLALGVSGGGVSAHGALTGLGDDDHTQYATNTEFDDHSARHESGGADAIKLDDLAAPDDVTDLNASLTAHGLLRKLDNVATNFLNGQGNWAVPAGGSDATAIHDDVSGEIAAIAEKTTPVSADLLLIEDSADANAKKRVQIGNLPGGGGSLDSLSDVVISSPSADQVLKYDGADWVNAASPGGGGTDFLVVQVFS